MLAGAIAFRVEVEKLAATADLVRDRFKVVFEDAFASFTDKLINRTATLKEALNGLTKDLVSQINSIAIQNIGGSAFGKGGLLGFIPDFFSNIFGGQGGAQGAVALQGSLAGAATGASSFAASITAAIAPLTTAFGGLSAAAGSASLALSSVGGEGVASSVGTPLLDMFATAFAHGGAIAGGRPSFTRAVSSGVFTGARRFHVGGIAGDEVPIIAKRGEGIFTPEQMANLAPVGSESGRKVHVTNHFTLMSPADPRTQAQVAVSAGRGINRALSRDS